MLRWCSRRCTSCTSQSPASRFTISSPRRRLPMSPCSGRPSKSTGCAARRCCRPAGAVRTLLRRRVQGGLGGINFLWGLDATPRANVLRRAGGKIAQALASLGAIEAETWSRGLADEEVTCLVAPTDSGCVAGVAEAPLGGGAREVHGAGEAVPPRDQTAPPCPPLDVLIAHGWCCT